MAENLISRTHTHLAEGGETRVKLAERGVCLNNRLWVREIERGHQTALLATDYQSNLTRVAACMFARWSQENFFKVDYNSKSLKNFFLRLRQ